MQDRSADDTRSIPTDGGITPLEPTAFGPYTVVARLGRGGMADVLLAIATGLAGFRKLVVIKKIRREMEEEARFIEMFLDEARLAARLEHPNVVQTHQVGAEAGRHFIAMEHLQGQTLGRIMRRHRRSGVPVSPKVVGYIIGEVLEGLAYAHELADFDGEPLNVIHRDVAPGNVMVTYEGVVKLLDFGVAKATTQLATTDPNKRKGKFAYIAPEQVKGTADQRSDIFSLGVVMWELLAGKRLFASSDPLTTLKNTMKAPIPTIHRGDLPLGLEAIVRKALRRNPEERFQSAREMRRELDRVMGVAGQVIRRPDLTGFMAEEFSDLKDAHARTIKSCVEAGLETATQAFELNEALGVPAPRVAAARWAGGLAERLRERWVLAVVGGVAAALLTLIGVAALSGGDEPEGAAETNVGRVEVASPATAAAAPDPEVGSEDQVEPPAAEPAEIDREAFERLRAQAREHFGAQRYAEAADSYRQATRMDPAHAGSFAGLGASLLAADDAEGAVAAYREAVGLAPDRSGFHAALGRAHRTAGHIEEAIRSYEEAIALDPNNAAAQSALSELQGAEAP